MRTLICLFFFCSSFLSAEDYNLKDVLTRIESRFQIRFIYSNEILFLRNGELATLTTDGSDYQQQELFDLLTQTLGLSFQNVDKRPKQFVIKPRISRIEERMESLENKMYSLQHQVELANKCSAENAKSLATIQSLLEQAQNKKTD